jgi:phosphinothricin acetyltransferase
VGEVVLDRRDTRDGGHRGAAVREGKPTGYGRRAMAGDPAAGDPAAGDPAAGDPAAGDPAAGDPAPGDVVIRLAERRDAAGIRAIYNHYVTQSTALFDLVPRTLDEQVVWIDEHSGGHPAVVAVVGDAVVGFGSLSPFKPRAAYAPTVEDSVYLLPGHHGVGIGRRVLDELIRLARLHGFHSVIARIAGGNDASIRLHEACGFEIVGTEREVGRKFGRWLDVVEMQRMLHLDEY